MKLNSLCVAQLVSESELRSSVFSRVSLLVSENCTSLHRYKSLLQPQIIWNQKSCLNLE